MYFAMDRSLRKILGHRSIATKLLLANALLLLACSTLTPATRASSAATYAAEQLPAWLDQQHDEGTTLCGLGIAGPSLDVESPYPKELSRQRAVANLAGIVATNIQEAFSAKEDLTGSSIDLVQILHVDEQLISKLDAHVEVSYFRDRSGQGPYQQKDFTYARACIGDQQLANSIPKPLAQLAQQQVASKATNKNNNQSRKSNTFPKWLARTGKQADGRLCAIGFSQPTFFAEETFEEVVRDIQTQLAKVVTTMIASATEEWNNQSQLWVESMTVATTEALAKGVVITQFWYDPKGLGPQRTARSTYGFGCAYPMDVLEVALKQLPEVNPNIAGQHIDSIRQRAEVAFSALDQASPPSNAPNSGPANTKLVQDDQE